MPSCCSARTSGRASCTSAPVARSALTTNSNGVLTFARYASGDEEFGRGQDRPHHLAQIAVGVAEPRRGAIDERRRRRVADEAARQLGRDEARRRRMLREDVEHLLAVRLAAARLDHVAEHDLLRRRRAGAASNLKPPPCRGFSIVQPVNARATSVTSFCV